METKHTQALEIIKAKYTAQSKWRPCIAELKAVEFGYMSACNTHDELVNALDRLIDWAECNADGTETLPSFQEAIATLRKARGEA